METNRELQLNGWPLIAVGGDPFGSNDMQIQITIN